MHLVNIMGNYRQNCKKYKRVQFQMYKLCALRSPALKGVITKNESGYMHFVEKIFDGDC